MSWNFPSRSFVPDSVRRLNAKKAVASMTKKGQPLAPVVLSGRMIARSFWGRAWCDNLESYSDYENRLPRGRTYVRNGAVLDLRIERGRVRALVSGSTLYKVDIGIAPLPKASWRALQRECAGQIHSLLELLQGRISAGVMQLVSRRDAGLFPAPKEIELGCSCPDWADMCKHVAAALYGVGARLDENPGLLFLLRGVDPAELITHAATEAIVAPPSSADGAPALTEGELSDIFGIDLGSGPPALSLPDSSAPTPESAAAAAAAAKPARTSGPAAARSRTKAKAGRSKKTSPKTKPRVLDLLLDGRKSARRRRRTGPLARLLGEI